MLFSSLVMLQMACVLDCPSLATCIFLLFLNAQNGLLECYACWPWLKASVVIISHVSTKIASFQYTPVLNFDGCFLSSCHISNPHKEKNLFL